MKTTNNNEIRRLIARSGLYYWQVAEMLNMRPEQLSILMRRPLAKDVKAKIRNAINQIKEAQE